MHAMKTALIAGAAALAMAGPAAAPAFAQETAADEAIVEAAGAAQALTGAERDAAIARANDYLNGLGAMKGRFQQINADGSLAGGDFYLNRPGRMRFEYDAPSPLLIVADGRTVAQLDTELGTLDRTLIDETPLGWLLKADVDLNRDTVVAGVARQDGLILIGVDDPRDSVPGQLVLIFSEGAFALREWVAIDDYGQQTRVILSDMTRQASLDPDLFTYEFRAGSRRPR